MRRFVIEWLITQVASNCMIFPLVNDAFCQDCCEDEVYLDTVIE